MVNNMNKTNVLIVRVNDMDLQLIQEAAKRDDMTVSSFIRNAARDRANAKGINNYGKEIQGDGRTKDK
jgi:uncharacterized protein (DUF1778 family)